VHRLRRIAFLSVSTIVGALFAIWIRAQEPQSPPASTTSPGPTEASRKPGKQKYSHANDFLIRGTVFNQKALSFAGVQLRIRRNGEKKFRWESATGSLGDFAVRVPQGYEYELVVHAKGFTDQTRTVDARNGVAEERIVFRMEPVTGGKR
jgi:hypothetical protein